jgi:twinkle protein
MMLNPKAEAWLEARAIDLEIASRMGIYSGRREQVGDEANVIPDPAGDILVFPYLEAGADVAAKYRGRPRADGSKVFWQRAGGRKTFYNADILDDPALIDGSAALVIAEGEPDCLAVLTAGYPFAVSVPDGAPADKDANGRPLAPVPHGADDIDPANDAKYSYIQNNWDRLSKIKRFVLFTDNDGPGHRLRDELARRLGRVRCSFVSYPDCGGKKADANEILIQHGPAVVLATIDSATPIPVRGLHRMSDFPEEPDLRPVTTGFGRLDLPVQKGMAGLMLERGLFMTVLGKPESGKSTWTTQLATNLARIHGWNVAIATFEMRRRQMYRLLVAAYKGKRLEDLTTAERAATDNFINSRFTFIHSDSVDEGDDPTIDWILDRAADAVIRDGTNVLIVDPWNEADHHRRPNESLTEYTGRAIKKMKRFANHYSVLLIVVIHPTKEGGLKQSGELSLYDASDSAHWVNKADLAVLIDRDYQNEMTTVKVGKVRYRVTGRKGETTLAYVPELEIFSQ